MNPNEMKTKIDCDDFYLQKPKPSFDLANEYYDLIVKNRAFLKTYLNWAFENETGKPEDVYKILTTADQQWKRGTTYSYLIHLTDTNEIIGGLDIFASFGDRKHTAEFEYWLAPQHNGRGIVTRAMRLLEPLLSNMGIQRFSFTMDSENTASENVAIRLGYEIEGIEKFSLWSENFQTYRDMKRYTKIIKK